MTVAAAHRHQPAAMDHLQPDWSRRQAFVLFSLELPLRLVMWKALSSPLFCNTVLWGFVKEKGKTILSSFPRLREQDPETVAGGARSLWFLEASSSASWVLAQVMAASFLTVLRKENIYSGISFSTDNFSLNSEMFIINPVKFSHIEVNKKVFKNVLSASASFKQFILSTYSSPWCCSLPSGSCETCDLSLPVEQGHPFLTSPTKLFLIPFPSCCFLPTINA